MMDLQTEAEVVARIASRLALASQAVRKERESLAEAVTGLKDAQDAQVILQHLAQAVQQQAHERISHVVSSCLSAVFDEPYEFRIQFERKRGRTEARLVFVREGLEVDPLTAAGGGMVDVAAFALRVSCLVLHRPKLSRVVVLDEPFRFVSSHYQQNVRSMLEQLAQEMKIQIIYITHNSELVAGKVIEL